MIRLQRIIAVLLILMSAALSAQAVTAGERSPPQPEIKTITAPYRILFVGNSFSYYNNSIHKHFGNLMRAADMYTLHSPKLRAMTISGGYLFEHEGGIDTMVQPDAWDVVVMHGYSDAPINKDKSARFSEWARKHVQTIRSRSAEPVFLMTWAYKNKPQMAAPMRDAYTSIANELGVMVIPVAVGFDKVSQEHPQLELYSQDILGFDQSDGDVRVIYKEIIKHPSLAGSYLAACIIYATLYNESPQGLVYDADLNADTAALLQSTAWDVVTEYFAD